MIDYSTLKKILFILDKFSFEMVDETLGLYIKHMHMVFIYILFNKDMSRAYITKPETTTRIDPTIGEETCHEIFML
jgi:hypothetical protein